MMARILDGKVVSQQMRARLRQEIADLQTRGLRPNLAVILVGEDPGSHIYVRIKGEACRKLGMDSSTLALPAMVRQQEVLDLIRRLNLDPSVHGILVQLPLPDHLDEAEIIMAVDPRKDVDGLHPVNTGRLLHGQPGLRPCTPAGILEILRFYDVELQGQQAVMVGRSNIVGKPMAVMLLERHATVTICHSRTRNLEEVTRRADVLVVACGRPGLIAAPHIKPGAVVIDVGIHRDAEGHVSGDVDFAAARAVAGAITPVPGGVGPMTVTMLLQNTVAACRALVGSRQ